MKSKSHPLILMTFVHDVFSFHGSFKPGNIWFFARLLSDSQVKIWAWWKPAPSQLHCEDIPVCLGALGMHRSENTCTTHGGNRAGLTWGITPPVDYGSTWDSKKMDFWGGLALLSSLNVAESFPFNAVVKRCKIVTGISWSLLGGQWNVNVFGKENEQ